MTKLFEEKITKLRNSLFPNDYLISGQDLIQDNLVQIHSLVDEIWRSNSSSKLELLTILDKELYKNLIVKLIHQRTDNIENLRCVLFKDLGSLYTQIGDLQKESANLNQGLKCYTDAAIFYQHSLHAMSRGYIKDQDTEIYQQLESIQQKILLSINGDSSIKFNDFNSESVKNCSQAKKEFLIKLRGNTRIKLDKFKTCYSKEEYNNSIQKLFTEVTGDMRGLLKSLYEEADKELQQKLGLETPCEYTIVGLGSMALNQMTPYSDLEFAIIIEKFTPEIVQYFRNLSHLVHFKCINIGETIIPTSKYGIDMSSLGKQGVNFDLGGKTPLGRINGDKVYDLIGTVEHLMNYVKSTSSTDKSLPFILENICLVKGSKSLVNEYKNAMQVFLKETYSGCEKKYQNKGLKNHQVKALKVLTEEIKEFDYKDPSKIATYKSDLAKLTPIFKTDDEGSLLDIKQEIYRLPDRMIYDLGMYLGIIGSSAWDTVNQLLKNEIISETGAKNLKNAISFATSLRLKSYNQSGSQTGMISTYIPALEHLKEEEKDKIVKTMFHIEDRKDLYDFFYVMMDFVDIIYFIAFPELQLQEQAPVILKKSNLFDDSNYLKAKVHAKFLDYDKALMYFKEVVKKCPDVLSLHEDLYTLCRKTCEIDEGLKTAENILVLNKKKYQNKINHPDIADSYNNLGAIYTDKGAYDLALTNHQKALDIKLETYADTPNHPDIAVSYNNLGNVYESKGEYDLAIKQCERALEIKLKAYANNPNHPTIADSYNSLGNVYESKGAYDLAIEHHQKALEIKLKAYANNPNHPSITGSYNSLGNVYNSKGAYDLAIEHHQKALEINLKAYTSIPNHLDIAASHNNLGNVYESKGSYDLAIKHYQKALGIQLEAYKSNPNHPSIAAGYNNLGLVYANKGLYDLAIEHHQKALEIKLKAYASSPNHPRIADSYNNLGLVYADNGSYDLAMEHYQKALEIFRKAYKKEPNHPDIAGSYNNLGLVYANKGSYDLAIKQYQDALEIRLEAYKSSPNHPRIAASYNNLGLVYASKGSYDLAIKQYKKALKIKLKAYADTPNHPAIADSYNNLGNAYESKGEYDLAIEYHQKALKIFRKAYADTPNHPAIADSYNNLGNAYHALGLYDLAFEHHQEALNIRLEAYKTIPNHPSIAESYGNLGNTCRACGLYDLAIEHCQKALEIRLKAYEDTPNHPDIADSRNNLGLVYFAKGLYDKAIGECSEALKIRLEAYEKINPNHPRIADSHNNLGLVYANKGLYDLAIKQYERALDIRLEAYKSSPNHPRIADSYNDLALVYIQKEEYDKALKYALESSNNTLIDIIYLQLGNNSFLSQDLENAQKYYEQIDSKLSTNLQECLSIIQFKYIDVIYEANLLSAAINCQKVLIKIDPELKYGNHYHNLACFSACQGNVEEANQAFIEGLNHKNAKTTAGLYVEYAQFLLLNKDNDILNINNDTITNYLYRAINCDNIGGLGYGKIEQNSVCDILQNLIKEKNTTIIIHPKILAYYLLITNPEYIKEDDDVETLLKSPDELCHTFYDSISPKILANAYSFSGYEVLSEKYSEYAKIMDKLEAIIANTALLESNREILKSDIVQELANNYYKLAYESLAKGDVGNSIKLFTKLFHIYEKKIIDNPESLQEIVNSIFTLSYIQNNIQQYIDLKVQYNAELDLRILKLLNLDTEQIQNYEKQLLFQLSPLIEKQKKALEEKNKEIEELSSDSNNLYNDKEIISPVAASSAANNSIDCSISGNLEETIE